MSDSITISQPAELPKRIAGICWGSPKTGKTTYCASSPQKKWLINLDPEGWLSVAHRVGVDTTVWDFSDLEPADLIKQLAEDEGAFIRKRIMDAPIEPGDSILFDSVTVLNRAGLAVAVKKGIGGSPKFSPSMEAPGLAAYGARTNYLIAAMSAVNRAARRKQAHTWFIAHEDTPERNEKGEFLYQSILMSENAINNASAAISEIWRMSEKDNARTVHIRSTGTHKPMGTRIFRTEEKKEFKLVYDIDKPDLEQPMSIASLWKSYLDGGMKKLHVPT